MLIRIRSTLGLITPLWVLLLWVGVPHFVECRRDTLLDEMEPVKEEDAGEYLQQFGYVGPSQLNVKTEGMAGDMASVSSMFESAVKAFQEIAHLPVTGVLDVKTRKKMAEPRCGMQDGVEMLTEGGGPAFKWRKNDLTYTFHNFTPDMPRDTVREAIRKAFGTWAAVTPLNFREVPSSEQADINIKFAYGMHDDPWPFDKRGGVLAHATMPPSGMLHFDESENWVFMDAAKIRTHKFTDLLPVAIHEGGHALGLSHSKAEDAIMAPFYQEQLDDQGNYIYPVLKPDDIRAIQAIYGPRSGGGRQGPEERRTMGSQGTARGGDEEEEEEPRGRHKPPKGGRGRHREEEEGEGSGSGRHRAEEGSGSGGGEQTLGQVLWNKGKKKVKQMFMEWLNGRRR